MNFQIRRATTDDAPSVGLLTRAAYARWVPLIGREPLPMKEDHEAAGKKHLVALLHVGGVLRHHQVVSARVSRFPDGQCATA